MDFKDWRKALDNPSDEPVTPKIGRFRGKQYFDYIDEQIHEAQARGDFDVLVQRGRRALRAHLKGDVDAGLAALETAVERALE